jgi:hypothetical protein
MHDAIDKVGEPCQSIGFLAGICVPEADKTGGI